MRRWKRGSSGPTLASAVLVLVLAQSMGAAAEDVPTADEVGSAAEGVAGVAGTDAGGAPPAGGEAGPAPGAVRAAAADPDDDSPGHETQDPPPPDHARGAVAETSLAGNELVTVGKTNAQIEDDGRASGDVVVLAVAGNEIVGAHSDSRTGPEEDEVAPLDALCEESSGGVCLGLLFASTSSSETRRGSSAEADTALAFVCLGGTQTDPDATCDGPVGAGAATSHSSASRDADGGTATDQETALAEACLGPEGEVAGTCSGVGITAARSESHSSASGDRARTRRRSVLLGVEIAGEEQVTLTEPTAVSIPPGCPEDPGSLLCLFLNQGEEFVDAGFAASRQEALHIDVLTGGSVPGSTLVLGHVGTAETRAHALRVAGDEGIAVEVAGESARPSGGLLAFTGFGALQGVALAFLLTIGGAAAVAWDRRRWEVSRAR